VRNVVRSPRYARARVVIGAIGALLGVVILVRSFAAQGLDWRALPAYVLGLALIALGVVRWREYAARRTP
jgi:hypothetical protein